MKAVVLVGGEGTRMRPLTETTPKPLIPFMNRPFLHHVLGHLAAHGVEEAILSSPYLEGRFRAFLEERTGSPAITWVTEEAPLGTSGAVAGVRERLNGTFLVLNGDVLTDLDLTALVGFHRERSAVGTIALTPVEDARPYGLVEAGDEGRVLAFREKPSLRSSGNVNAGIYVLEPGALDGVERGVKVSIERETFPSLIARGAPLYARVTEGYWADLGTPEAYLDAHADALAGRVRLASFGPAREEGAAVAANAILAEGVVLGPDSRIGEGASVRRSVLHGGASIGERAEVEGSILGRGAEVGDASVVRDTLLGEGAAVPPGAQVEGARISALATPRS